MKFLSSIALTALFAGSAIAAPLVINTPVNVVSGQPTLLTWSGGKAPFFLSCVTKICDRLLNLADTFISVEPGNDPSGPALENLGEQKGTAFVWDTNVAPGTVVGFELRDSKGTLAQSAPVVVQ